MAVPKYFYLTSTEPGKLIGTFKRVTIVSVNGSEISRDETLACENWSTTQQCWLEDFEGVRRTSEGGIISETKAYDTVNVPGEFFDKLVCADGYTVSIDDFYQFPDEEYVHTAIVYKNPDGEVQYAVRGSDSYSGVRLMCKMDVTGSTVTGIRALFYQTYPDPATNNVLYLTEVFPPDMQASLVYKPEGGPGGPGITPPGGEGSGGSVNPPKKTTVMQTESGEFIITEYDKAASTLTIFDWEHVTPKFKDVIDIENSEVNYYDEIGAFGKMDGSFGYPMSDITKCLKLNDYWWENSDFKMGSSIVYYNEDTDQFVDGKLLDYNQFDDFPSILMINDSLRFVRSGAIGYLYALEAYDGDAWVMVDQTHIMNTITVGTLSHYGSHDHHIFKTADDKFGILSFGQALNGGGGLSNFRTSYFVSHMFNDEANELLNGVTITKEETDNTNDNISDGEYEGEPGEREGEGVDESGTGRKDENIDDPLADASSLDGGMSTGFFRIYNPSLNELQALASEMNAGDAWTELKKFFQGDPMDGIITMHMVPMPIRDYGTLEPVKIGNFTSTTQMRPITKRYISFEFGETKLQVCYKYHEYLNHDPYTKISLYLPYIGVQPVNTDDVMGRKVKLTYIMDVITGAVVAVLYVSYDGAWHPRYIWNGTAIAKLPLTGRNHNELISSLMNSARTVATSAITGNMGAAVSGLASAAQGLGHVNVNVGSAFSGQAGWMGSKQAFFIITNPAFEKPEEYEAEIGLPANITKPLSSISSGFVKFREFDVNGIPATSDELTMIKDEMLKGVYIK